MKECKQNLQREKEYTSGKAVKGLCLGSQGPVR